MKVILTSWVFLFATCSFADSPSGCAVIRTRVLMTLKSDDVATLNKGLEALKTKIKAELPIQTLLNEAMDEENRYRVLTLLECDKNGKVSCRIVDYTCDV